MSSPPPIRESIQAIRTLAPRLNQASDEINATFRLVEEFLTEECHVGIEKLVPVAGQQHFSVAFLKHNGKFRVGVRRTFFYENEHGQESEGTEFKPWSECSREEKVAAFAQLPALLGAIASDVQNTVTLIDKSEVSIREMLDVLGIGSQKSKAAGNGRRP